MSKLLTPATAQHFEEIENREYFNAPAYISYKDVVGENDHPKVWGRNFLARLEVLRKGKTEKERATKKNNPVETMQPVIFLEAESRF